MAESRLWRIRTVLLVPMYTLSGTDGGLPETLEFESRLPEQAKAYGDVTVAIQQPVDDKLAGLYGDNPQVETVWLVADVPAGDEPFSAVEKLAPIFEELIDLLMFEMGSRLGIGQMDVTDITPPLTIGEDRATALFTAPPFHRHSQSVDMQVIQGRLIGQLPDSLDAGDSKTAAVLRWFVKSLGTNLLHDQFIFLWIGLEILCDASEVRIEEPYVGRCGHEIANCPDCDEPTTRMVRGATIRAFLEELGVDEEQAKRLWQMRQLMHGAIPFDSDKLSDLGALVQPLRAVVAAGLKARLGKEPADPPIVAPSGFSIHPAMAMQGSGQVTEEDIRPLT
jgi:hypothetical protein